MSNSNPFRLAMQALVAGAVLLIAAGSGLLGGSLAPLVRIEGLEIVIVPLMLSFYVMVGFLFVFGAMAAAQISGATTGESGRNAADSGMEWEHIATALAGTAVGSVVGGGLVFGVPDWLSTTLPLVALFAAAVAFVFAGDAVSIRGLDTALSSAGGTIYLFVVPAALYPVFDIAGLLITAVIGTASFLVARRWVRNGLPVDRRLSVAFALVFALVAGGAMAYDLSGPRPAVELDTDATVNLSAAENQSHLVSDYTVQSSTVPVGTLSAGNTFEFQRTADVPSYVACLYDTGGERIQMTAGHGPVLVVEEDQYARPVDEVRLAGDQRRQYSVVLLLDSVEGRSLTEIRDLGTVPVRRAERCPDTTDGPALVLVPTSE
ncbi:hypothetical protein ACOZ4N_16290 [Halorientalis pallida]|uniref:hypothetical protein n=1 Tax=Halorientalis pallida TaxID=2479928 RepID=UPI003C6FEA8B